MSNVWINEKYFNKNKQEAKTRDEEDCGKEDSQSFFFENIEKDCVEDMEITETGISISISNKLGYFSFDIPLDTDDLMKLIEIAIKKMNKFKNILEGLK